MRNALKSRRVAQIETYFQLLAPLTGIGLPPKTEFFSHFPIEVSDSKSLHEHLLKKGIYTSLDLFSKLLCDYPKLQGSSDGPLASARHLTKSTLQLPLYYHLTSAQQSEIATAISEWEGSHVNLTQKRSSQ